MNAKYLGRDTSLRLLSLYRINGSQSGEKEKKACVSEYAWETVAILIVVDGYYNVSQALQAVQDDCTASYVCLLAKMVTFMY